MAKSEGKNLEPGAIFAGSYRIEKLLGAGGMGVVYEASRGDGRVALKVMHRHLLANQQVTKRFYREAEILRRLSGEHLVALRDFGVDDDERLYMALDLVEGEALDREIVMRGLPSVKESLSIMIDVCSALESAHALGVIHRDLKPANILLESRPNETARVRVCDFGLAKALKESGFATTALTEQHMVFGTPEYMSPEQVRGEDCDARADVYSAGCVLYELLTGRPPFSAKTSVATMTAHITETPQRPSLRAPERRIRQAIDAVALHALGRELDQRYQSARELREALVHALEAPDDATSVRPQGAVDLEQRDTALALPSSKPPRDEPVDPLGTTVQHDVPRDLLKTPISRPSGVTPEELSPIAPSAVPGWVWIVVALAATAAGIALGFALRG
jgi:serine/threonine-protein kinase